MTVLSLTAVSVAVVYLLGLGFYGESLYAYQKALLADTLSLRVVASCTEVSDLSRRFTGEKMRELHDRDVALIFPRLEQGIKLANGLQKIDVFAESTVPGDPGLAAARLSWGQAVSSTAAHEIVVPRSLFEKLGGTLTDAGLRPDHLTLEVGRVAGGRPQVHAMPVRVTGLVRFGLADRVYIPLQVAEHLQLWCEHKIESMPGANGRVELPRMGALESAVAFGPKGQQGRVPDEARQFQVTVQPASELTLIDAQGDLWGKVTRAEPGATADVIKNKLPADLEYAVSEVRTVTLGSDRGGKRLVALAADDPRWQSAPGRRMPAFGQVLAAAEFAPTTLSFGGLTLAVVGHAPALPGGGDYYCAPATLDWLTFEIEWMPAFAIMTLVQTDDVQVARRMAETDATAPKVSVSDPFGWRVYEVELPAAAGDRAGAKLVSPPAPAMPREEPAGMEKDPVRVPEMLDVVQKRYPGARVGSVHTQKVLGEDLKPITVRFLPGPLFRRLAPAQAPGGLPMPNLKEGAIPCLAVGLAPLPSRISVASQPLAVIRELPGTQRELWLDTFDRVVTYPEAAETGFALWGAWDALPATQDLQRQSRAVRLVGASAPPRFSWLYEGPREQLTRRLDPGARIGTLTTLWTMAGKLEQDGGAADVVCATAASAEGAFAVADGVALVGPGALAPGLGRPRLILDGGYCPTLELRVSAVLPPEVVYVNPSTFRRLAFESESAAGRVGGAGNREVAIQVPAPRFSRLRAALKQVGLAFEMLSPARERSVVEYQVRAAAPEDTPLDADRVAALAMAQPTFFAALPRLGVPALLQDRQTTLEASRSDDPRQFRADLTWGRWLSRRGPMTEVVLPAALAGALAADRPKGQWVGRDVLATFRRDRGVGGPDSTLSITLRVVGISEGTTAYTSLELVQGVALWREGKVIYNDSQKMFEAPAAVSQRQGHVRCNIDVRDSESVARVVARLESQGYRTEHHLAEQQGLRKLGRILVFLVMLFVVGFAFNAVITVLITNAMNIANKTHEIGILRAHGLGAFEIVSIFGIQGVVCGMVAFVLGSALMVGVEPLLTGLLRETFKLPPESIPTPLFSTAHSWLFVWSSVLAVCAALVGAVLPALQACRLTPVQAMHRVE
jgi:hypothetical protein